jgi:deoxyribonuclease-1-like protein
VQRILSLATLGVLGGLVWMFLSGGGLNQLAETADPAAQQGGSWNSGGAFNWPNAASQPTTPTTGNQPPLMPTIATGPTAPPGDFGPTIKIASFNIENFGQAKAAKPHVMEALARIIRMYDVVAIQEISTQDDSYLPNFLRLVNGTGRHYAHQIGVRVGNSTQTEQFAYIYDADRVYCSPTSVYTVGDPDNLISREPFVASFSTRTNPDVAFTFTLINVHTTPDPASVLRGELDALAEVYRVVRRAGVNEDDVIMLGDFNADDMHLGRLGQIPDMRPLIRGVFTNTRQNALYDNILVHGPSTTEFAGKSGVFDLVRQANLSLADAELVSDHFPVFAEFSVYERDYAGGIARRGGLAR